MIDLASEAWAYVLRGGLGAEFTHLPDGGTLACFRAGPFRVAYPDFMIGSGGIIDPAMLELRVDAARRLGADLVRMQAAAIPSDPRTLAVHELGTVAIPSLAQWTENRWEKARRAANRQRRSPLVIREGTVADGAELYRLYLSTLRRRGGSVRYTRKYFELVAPRALVAEWNGKVCGFVCAGFHGRRACYMHGAHDPQARSQYPSDQLFLGMLRAARDAGMEQFDFLPSPSVQASLVKYKEAWGGEATALSVGDFALRPLRARGFEWAVKSMRLLERLRRA